MKGADRLGLANFANFVLRRAFYAYYKDADFRSAVDERCRECVEPHDGEFISLFPLYVAFIKVSADLTEEYLSLCDEEEDWIYDDELDEL